MNINFKLVQLFPRSSLSLRKQKYEPHHEKVYHCLVNYLLVGFLVRRPTNVSDYCSQAYVSSAQGIYLVGSIT